MASNDVEVLDPATTVEKLKKFPSERVLNRRHFIAALGVAGAAAGTELVSSGPAALAQEPVHNGYAQSDVLNFLLNVKYLKATFYSYITQGADLPAASQVTVGSGAVYNTLGVVKFSTQQITDLFNEMYYDELNQLIALRSLLGVAVSGRQSMDLLGTGSTTAASATINAAQAISIAQFLSDLGATAFAGASIYLTGANLQYAAQVLASDASHAGALRLLSIQTGAGYNFTGTQYFSFTGAGIAGSSTMYAFVSSTQPVKVNYVLTTSPTIAIAGDVNGNYKPTPTNNSAAALGAASAPGISSPVTVTAIGTIPTSYATTYAFPQGGQHHDNALYDVPASIGATLQPGMPVSDSGKYFPNPGTYIVSVTPGAGYGAGGDTTSGTESGPDLSGLSQVGNYTVEVSATSGGHAPGTISFGTTPITLSAPLPSTGAFTATTIGTISPADPEAVIPADIGPGVATTGPAVIAPNTLKQGFFATAGSAANGAPAGLAFARTFSQVLAILYNNPTTSTYEGGYYPVGVSGNINVV